MTTEETPATNLDRRSTHYNAAKTCCRQGHPFTADNTRIRRGGARTCRACERLRGSADYAARILPPTPRERFDAFTYHEPNTGCWLWTGAISTSGYGAFKMGRECHAHRVAWILWRGPIPQSLQVLHRCDTRPCVNPGHLFLGTQAANMEDMTLKGRRSIGARHGMALLTEQEVVEIKSALSTRPGPGLTAELARRYGVTKTAIYWIAKGRNWAHVEVSP